jgi:hypothetical protein
LFDLSNHQFAELQSFGAELARVHGISDLVSHRRVMEDLFAFAADLAKRADWVSVHEDLRLFVQRLKTHIKKYKAVARVDGICAGSA